MFWFSLVCKYCLKWVEAGDVIQAAEHVPCKREALSSNSSAAKQNKTKQNKNNK
jgi:hypothetical protein